MALKVGDRARRVCGHNEGSPIGHEAVVASFEDGGSWAVFEDGTRGFTNSFVPVAEAAGTFKVGDRVRLTKYNSGFGSKGDVGAIDTIDAAGNAYVKFETGSWAGELWWVPTGGFQPVAVAAQQLTIRAGAFYKTRDGRKVGPVEESGTAYDTGEPVFGAEVDGTSRLWRACGGKHLLNWDYLDLIAEWPTDTADTTASNDNEPPVAEPRFKVGDPIRVIDPSGFRFGTKAGDRGVVTKDYDGGASFVDINLNHETDGTIGQIARPSQIELATTIPAIVCLLEDGQPLPATRPFVHANADAASGEAARLAKKHPGKAFAVYEYKRTAKVEPVYEHEWQRLAVSGQKIAAIKELRGLAGIDLAAAKAGVDQFLMRAA
ncbi:hypothetical protein EET67_04955 [Pseudaminobacter arsenicus]|uniref:Uncharacterized protein n=1 Tax=Borborobacter arsenicus TaxID=1851146 RepID=A0A432VA74_9HYPH|nr:hypothetical protein [Pseudaminobacter arsenicus]RUM98993.1 hypothetical protein EET67_04955 [Pseudaminobacter arsenicus]